MEDLWKMHKKFILLLSGGVVVLLIWYLAVYAPIRSAEAGLEKELKREKSALRDLLAQGRPGEGVVGRIQSDRKMRREMLNDAAQDLYYLPPPRFSVPKGDSARKHFDDLRISLLAELKDNSVSKSVIPPPSFGLETLPPEFPEEVAKELLLRLSMIEHFWRTLLDKVKGDRTRILNIQSLLGNGDPSNETIIEKKRFLNRVSVEFELVTEADILFRLLDALQSPDNTRYLAVTNLEATREDLSGNLMKVRIEISALIIDADSPLEPVEEGERTGW